MLISNGEDKAEAKRRKNKNKRKKGSPIFLSSLADQYRGSRMQDGGFRGVANGRCSALAGGPKSRDAEWKGQGGREIEPASGDTAVKFRLISIKIGVEPVCSGRDGHWSSDSAPAPITIPGEIAAVQRRGQVTAPPKLEAHRDRSIYFIAKVQQPDRSGSRQPNGTDFG